MSDSSLPLVTQAKSKNRAAVEELLVRHLPGLQGWLRLRMGKKMLRREAPEDVVQSVAREVLGDMSNFEWRGEAAFRHWLYQRAQRKLVDKARYTARERRDPDREIPVEVHSSLLTLVQPGQSPSGQAQSAEEIARIEQAFDELPEDYREAISLQRLCEMDYPQIAEQMDRSEGAVRNLVYRGLSRLAVRLGELRREQSRG